VLSVGGISSAWAVRSATAGDGSVFKRPSGDPQNQSGSGDSAQRSSQTGGTSDEPGAAQGKPKAGPQRLTPPQLRAVEELSQRDRHVRAHESAHQAAAGGLGGAASFTYEVGPDGKSYAIGGEVPIDMSPGRTPEETISRAVQIRAAALAPADPSAQDLSVAAEAAVMEAVAEQQLTQERLAALAEARAKSAPRARASEPVPELRLPGQKPAANETAAAGSRAEGAPDMTERAAATIAALQADRSSSSPSASQLQQMARLASMAYRGRSSF
jgi:hypothetical protein